MPPTKPSCGSEAPPPRAESIAPVRPSCRQLATTLVICSCCSFCWDARTFVIDFFAWQELKIYSAARLLWTMQAPD